MRGMLGVLLLTAGCSGDDGSGDVGGPTDTPDTDTGTTDTDLPETASCDQPPIDGRSAFLEGTLRDATGAGVPSAQILFCRGEACRNGRTDSTGAFCFDQVHVDWHSLEIRPPNAGQAPFFAPLQFGDDETRTLDLVMPNLDPATALQTTPAEIETGAGLYITVGSDDLEPPLFFDPATEVAGVLLEQSQWVPTDGIAGTVLAQWFVSPFDYHAAGGLPVRIENTFGLADTTTTRVYVGSYELSQWVDAGTLTATGGWLEGAAELPLLSTVLLVQE